MVRLKFAQEKQNTFDRSLHSLKVEDFDQLKDLVLVEEFKKCISSDNQAVSG